MRHIPWFLEVAYDKPASLARVDISNRRSAAHAQSSFGFKQHGRGCRIQTFLLAGGPTAKPAPVDFAVLAWAVLGLWPPDIGLDRDSHTALTVPHEAGAGMTLPASVQNDILHDICDKMTYLIK